MFVFGLFIGYIYGKKPLVINNIHYYMSCNRPIYSLLYVYTYICIPQTMCVYDLEVIQVRQNRQQVQYRLSLLMGY